jgi:hypothetical protein
LWYYLPHRGRLMILVEDRRLRSCEHTWLAEVDWSHLQIFFGKKFWKSFARSGNRNKNVTIEWNSGELHSWRDPELSWMSLEK